MLTCESLENSKYVLSSQKQPHWEMAYKGIKGTDTSEKVEMCIFKHRDLKINKNTKLGIWIFSSHQELEVYMLGVGACVKIIYVP